MEDVTEALGSRGKAETRQTAVVQVSFCDGDRSSDRLSSGHQQPEANVVGPINDMCVQAT